MKISCKLLPHQSTAAQKLKGLKVGALFMEMGTGKTVTAMELIRQRAHKINRVIYLTPVNLIHSVAIEFARHSPETEVCAVSANGPKKLPEAFVYVFGIESIAQSDRLYLLCNKLVTAKTCVILDESDMCKNHAALRTMRITAMGDRAKYRFALTGTPVGEGVVDLYAQMRFLSAKILGYSSFYSFAANHLVYSEEYLGRIVRSLKTDYIAKKIEPFVYQVTKEECLELPKKTYDSVSGWMTPEQLELYTEAKWDILGNCPLDELDSYAIFRLFTALREIVSGFWNQTPHPDSWRVTGNLKDPVFRTCAHNRLALLDESIEGIPATEKVIIWANFNHCSRQIAEHLAKAHGSDSLVTYNGETKDKARAIQQWRDSSRFLVASPKCGGRGLTLNESCHVIFYNNDFPYRLRAQAEDRCHRIGQSRSPSYTDLILPNTLDERIAIALANKESVVEQFKRELDKIKDPEKKRAKLFNI